MYSCEVGFDTLEDFTADEIPRTSMHGAKLTLTAVAMKLGCHREAVDSPFWLDFGLWFDIWFYFSEYCRLLFGHDFWNIFSNILDFSSNIERNLAHTLGHLVDICVMTFGVPQGGGGEAAAPLWGAAEGRTPKVIKKISKRCPKGVPGGWGASLGDPFDIFRMTFGNRPEGRPG